MGKNWSNRTGVSRTAIKTITGMLLAGLLTGGFLFNRTMDAPEPPFDTLSVKHAEKMFGLTFNEAQRDSMLPGLLMNLRRIEQLHGEETGYEIHPAIHFTPVLPAHFPRMQALFQKPEQQVSADESVMPIVPENREELAFYPVNDLSLLLRNRKITSEELTRLYLDRIRRYDDQLHTVVTLTEELALEQARRADREIAEGFYRGPLHGIPYGTKDLLALQDYPVTWGSAIFRDQIPGETATVIRKLEEAGAVHLAKLSLGELAWGDVWFGGTTRTPWDTEVGSSGSSAGSASATAAGLVAFSIGSETYGSIVSPCTRTGTTGLRPTFGRVSRHGAMALSWSMDKVGPITRTAHDAALVFDVIRGPGNVRVQGAGHASDLQGGDPARRAPGTGHASGLPVDDPDPAVVDLSFHYPGTFDFAQLTVGYLAGDFERDYAFQEFDRRVLQTLEELGARLVPISLPDLPTGPLHMILSVEAAAAFDELTRSGRDSLMVRQIRNAWPNVFRTVRFVPAVEYIQANRLRTRLMQEMEKTLRGVDVYVAPSFAGNNLLLTNLTGHPLVVVPTGFSDETGLPASITFNGHLYEEGLLLALAKAYQEATGHHKKIPERFMD